MAEIYFCFSNPDGVLVNPRTTAVEDFLDLREQANRIVRELIASPGPQDWRNWVLHVSDGNGEEVFTVPFAAVLGRPH